MSGFQAPINIQQAIYRIQENEYLLPAFQREFVWSSEQIEKLFDSLMRGYPISSMLFWKVRGATRTDFRFYKFLTSYIQIHKTHNNHIRTDNLNDFHAILDGQQRLTSLYIGLCGSYAYRLYRHSKKNSEQNFPSRTLYLNISKKYTEDDETDMEYIFSFLPTSETNEDDLFTNSNGIWFKVGRILSLHKGEYDLDDFTKEHQIEKASKKILRKLDRIIHNENLINYYEEDEQDPDKAVNIFVRINSGGTHLSFSDILLSIAVANWQKKDARTEISGLVDAINSTSFTINKDYVLKSFLFLFHKEVRTKINSFNNGFIEKIEDNWESIRDAINSVFDLMQSYGLTGHTLTTYNATLPILYYLYHKGIWKDFATKTQYKEDRKAIKKWLFTILIRRTFGGQSDTVLTQARRAFTNDVEKNKCENINIFPSKEVLREIKKIVDVGDDYLEDLLLTQKDNRYSFSILAMLYPDLDYKNNNFHIDHLHPAARYEELSDENKAKHEWKVYNSILNLQMLDSNENMSKSDMPLNDWVEKMSAESGNKNSFLNTHIIPNLNLGISNFSDFIEKRKEILLKKLRELIS